MRRLIAPACALGLIAVVVALTRHGSGANTSAVASRVKTVGCASQVRQPLAPAGRDDLVVGPTILRAARARARDRPSTYQPRRGRDVVAKVALVVQPGTRLVLSVDRRDRAGARLVYREATRGARHVAKGDGALRFASCFDDAPTGWPGGFIVAGPRCVRILVDIDGHPSAARRTLGFGRRGC
jgi:hypothetical protein